QEILRAAERFAEDVQDGRMQPQELTEALFSTYLYTPELPDPDLLIRTSGEMRLSNFLLWQLAYAELYVIDALWPDFNESLLLEAIAAYQKRDRRFGGVGP
ncbi:MAG: di-trans,poly-cis-decaprenylcistransferase, partial [Gemmatimonadetes bacterium]|nr:di-trans,poly-cis-decaprenylcistransferase [Gemmatimonadota bacterium]